MRLTKNERKVLLTTLIAVLEKLLDVSPEEPASVSGKRTRRSRADAAKLRQKVRAERKRNRPVKLIARELGVTPAYVYQIGKSDARRSQS